MKVIKIDNNKISAQIIAKITRALKQGEVVVYPTETFYGLGCDATNAQAVAKIFKIKGRQRNKALPFLVSDIKMARKYLRFNRQAKMLAAKFWPGPLSLVLDFNANGRKIFKKSINQKSFDAGARISSNKIAALIVKKLGKPLISTSANLSGWPAASEAKTVIKYWQRRKFKPDVIIDAGKLPPSLGSTLVDARSGKIIILRKGDLESIIKEGK